ncbi:glycerophosphoryl diester phosphodiesterase membrane domain-containing protein [Microbacterium sp. No. 7]|uniref:glycerophosphoryl diester phosphodiesterase membrane domain-containing protein n=1 Tax=Microbacterium sp. No. 7 TaxID=1714373 RepID=UPI0006D2427C|nr:glycerophosphoryl diester phosphodiesterase membrane domain-containing protein [Microbacterium sp. No. 7]ALJ21279.1 hypothetical protein AOA12_15780 [Microbacterium sp. No. 7]
MTVYPAWTPASRPGIVPLRPLTFGTILGRSFTALRQNPRVLLGFALVVQAIVTLVASTALAAVGVWAVLRIVNVPTTSDDFEAILIGSTALVAVVGVVIGIASTAFSAVVQGVVVVEVSREVLAEKLTLRELWARVRPVFWRLVGYMLLLMLAVVLATGAIVGALIGLSVVIGFAALFLGILAAVAALPLYLWLTVKLLLVPAAIVIEHATIRGAIARSWRLTRGRFWSTLGIVVIISLAFGFLAQLVSTPLSLLSIGMEQIFAPTGDPEAGAIISLLVGSIVTQVIVVLIQAVGMVVQATATSLVYVDCRMRHEGLDIDLLSYVERRDAGEAGLADPYTAHIGRVVAPRPAAPPFVPGYGYPTAPGHAPAPGYAPPPSAGPPPGPGYAPPAPAGPPPVAAPAAPPPSPVAPSAPAPPGGPAADAPAGSDGPPSPTQWAPPGGGVP